MADDQNRLRELVLRLCSDDCAGRAAGTPEGHRAGDILLEALTAAGLTPTVQPVPGCRGRNLIATVGAGPRTVLCGAHYDHLGRTEHGTYWGADDNAAACAVVIELARAFSSTRTGRVIFALFDGEEPPHFMTGAMGSIVMAAAPPVPLDSIDLMIAMDLVGHPVGPPGVPAAVRDTLFVLGAEKSAGTHARVARAADKTRLAVRQLDIDVVPPLSDYHAFREAHVPFLFLTAGRWRHYHTPEDTPEKLDYARLSETVAFVSSLIQQTLGLRERPRYDDTARDRAGTVRALEQLTRALAKVSPEAHAAAEFLAPLASRLAAGEGATVTEWSRVLMVIAGLEQGLA